MATHPSSATSVPLDAARGFLAFINASPTPYHAVQVLSTALLSAGFTPLSERDAWASPWSTSGSSSTPSSGPDRPSLAPGGKYFTVRGGTSLVAFTLPPAFTPTSAAFVISGAHTDSPGLRLKPISASSRAGYLTLGVETYGGLLQHTWLDRDLSVAGRVILKSAEGGFATRVVAVDRPILRIPSLAIHLDREVNSAGLKLNAETHLSPILATSVKSGAAAGGERHHSALIQVVADTLGVAPGDIVDVDLNLVDTVPAVIGGVHSEFLYSGRLDNLMMTYLTFTGLIASSSDVSSGGAVRVAAAFDHEECGSSSVPGAGSSLLEETLTRILGSSSHMPPAIRRSLFISADMAHAVHPNYAAVHEEKHRPAMHGGIVIKINANQRYATSSVTGFQMRTMAEEMGVPTQPFVVRQDMGCGSTIGPIVATRLGIRTVDVGLPQLSMHSIREMCGTDDVHHGLKFFTEVWSRYPALDARCEGMD